MLQTGLLVTGHADLVTRELSHALKAHTDNADIVYNFYGERCESQSYGMPPEADQRSGNMLGGPEDQTFPQIE